MVAAVALMACFNGGEDEKSSPDSGSAQCDLGFADCNGDSSDVCEVNLSTSPEHCLECGTACDDNQICSITGCVSDPVFISGQARPVSVAVDSTHVYWLNAGVLDALQNAGPGNLMRLGLSGGAPEVIVPEITSPLALIVDETHVYWGERSAGLWKAPKDGSGVPAQVVNTGSPAGVTQTTTHLFWEIHSDPTFEILSIGKDGTGLKSLVVAEGDPPIGLAVNDEFLYYSSAASIARTLADGSGAQEALATYGASFIRLKGTEVFGMTGNSADEVRVQMLGEIGSNALNLAVEDGCNDKGLVVDDQNVYFAFGNSCRGPDKIVSSPKQPGTATLLIDNLDAVSALTIGDSHLYWTTQGKPDEPTGAVYRILK